MTSVALLTILLLETFLAADMDSLTEPVLDGLRTLEATAYRYTRKIVPQGPFKGGQRLTRFYLFTQERSSEGRRLDMDDPSNFRFFNPRLETKIIIHGFMDKIQIAGWMHHMKDEFLMLDNFNVIVVDWSMGNFIPYTQAAENTERIGMEIAELINKLKDEYGARADKFHVIGHSLGSHVAGYVGEQIKGLKRITGLDPATYLFSNASPRTKLDLTDAQFVDVIHTDGGGIGMREPVGHVDFYPNGGEIQTGCTASNSLRALLERGVVEGVRNMVCSHMRAAMLFTETINVRKCQPLGYKCPSWEAFSRGECDSCGRDGVDCAIMGYHVDLQRNYGNSSMYYLLTGDAAPFCGFEYKIAFKTDTVHKTKPKIFSSLKKNEWSSSDILQISVYGSAGNADFQIEGPQSLETGHVLFSPSFLGDVLGAIIRWSKKPLSRMQGVVSVLSEVVTGNKKRPFIQSIHVSSLKTHTQWKISPIVFELCVSPVLSAEDSQQGATFRSEYC